LFLTAPLAYLLFNLNIIHSSASLVFAYALPHLFLAIYVNSRMNGRYRYSFWGDLRPGAGLPHALPTVVTMFFPKRGKFNVTDKGALLDVGYFDFSVVRPHLIIALLLAAGVIAGIVRACAHDYFGVDPRVIALNVGWGLYSLIFLLAAIAVARETRQTRKTIRIDVKFRCCSTTPAAWCRAAIPLTCRWAAAVLWRRMIAIWMMRLKRLSCCCNPARSSFR
jgi:cellulose synthase (UDP-forming)